MTPFLAALLEKDQTRTWPFDQFFEQVAAVASKVVINVFCPSMLLTMKIYANKTDTLVLFLLAEDVGVFFCVCGGFIHFIRGLVRG